MAPPNEFGLMEAGEQGAFNRAAPPIPPAVPRTAGRDLPVSGAIATSLPQIAYAFAYGFRVPADTIRPLQERHADMCEAKGPQVCRIVSMDSGEREGDYAYGNLSIAVASDQARQFGKALTAASGQMDGELTSSSIQGEDLSKRIVDTEARLRARTVLRDRLMEVLRNRSGTVAELVEAERGVAQVNEEIDQARSWLAEMRGRVAYSTMTLEYEAGAPSQGGFVDPIRNALGSLASIFGNLIAFLLIVVTVLLLVGLLLWGGIRAFRKINTIGGNAWIREPDATET
ncbi:DUF4349 domain-containing protein [Erythrobacter litoralis]|uniref:DUF4349 domain-containing protein n=1 Tax=Erythrobacter litoralis TaxID=39960 RepID=UPI0024356A7B|nr:DUF4349 domain-containing protein [Erythrobacter litoralis]MDG6078757.1 DUF4349 domain-containing protein [Erythrobacter litoralis]